MTADELQRIALRVANWGWTRYWLHWNYPCQLPWVMAIQILDCEGRPIQAPGLDRLGFEWDEDDRRYYVDRTTEDGMPYKSLPQ